MRRLIYRWHKWLAVTVGVFFIAWIVSGVFMILPERLFQAEPRAASGTAEFGGAVVSPSRAVESTVASLGPDTTIVACRLTRLQDEIVYVMVTGDGTRRLVDARTGQPFEVTGERAVAMARAAYPSEAGVLAVERLESHTAAYRWGELPAYQVTFEDDPSVWYYVEAHTGRVTQSSGLTRLRAAIMGLHTFQPMERIVSGDRYRKLALVLLSVVGLAVSFTGYYMAFPRRRRRTDTAAEHVPATG